MDPSPRLMDIYGNKLCDIINNVVGTFGAEGAIEAEEDCKSQIVSVSSFCDGKGKMVGAEA